MAVALDHISLLEAHEVNGTIRRMTRRARVTDVDIGIDYHALNAVLNEVGVPALHSTPTGVEFAQLILVARKPKLLHDPSCWDIDLDYEHILEGPNQNLSLPTFGTIFGKTKVSVQQKTTNLYRENGIGDQKTITVSHTFPSLDSKNPGKAFSQGGEVTIYQPQRNLHFSGHYATPFPWVLANYLIASINSSTWVGQGETEWMCVEVAWELMKLGRYQFEFNFQHNPDGWNPTAVFIDEDTGRPPVGLKKDVGYKVVPYHRKRDFNAVFNAFFGF